MALSSVHPLYADNISDWAQLRIATKGEKAVKEAGMTYLPATAGMALDGLGVDASGKPKLGQSVYNSYKARAVFPDYMMDALEYFMGALHNKSPVIELPKEMEFMRDNATPLGEPLEILLQRINLEQLTTGRVGILLDLARDSTGPKPEPFIALYVAEAIRNWDDGIKGDKEALKMVVLDESGPVRVNYFDWQNQNRYRVLQLGSLSNDAINDFYHVGVFSGNGTGEPDYVESELYTPVIYDRPLTRIPFQFINTKDISPEPDVSPLISLCRQCFTVYRGEADYRQNLFMQGQDTLVIKGGRQASSEPGMEEEPVRVGAGSRIDIDAEGDAKYIGVNSQGLSEQRIAIANDRKRCESRSGQLIDATQGDKESGAALRTRVGAQTATLNQIARTGALALEKLLRTCAVWLRLDPSQVRVQPNIEFADYQMAGQDMMNLMSAKRMGFPISDASLHRLGVQGNLTRFDYQSELTEMQKEGKMILERLEMYKEAEGQSPVGEPAPKDPSNPAPQVE